jgi:predicted nucleic acid-binding protein
MGLTVVDAGPLIGFLDADDAHHQGARRALREAGERVDRLVVPASALAEILVGPSRRGDDAVAHVRSFVERVPIEVAVLDEDVAVAAAAIRAEHPSTKLPDALVIATAVVLEADRLVTTDRRWPPPSSLGLRAVVVTV